MEGLLITIEGMEKLRRQGLTGFPLESFIKVLEALDSEQVEGLFSKVAQALKDMSAQLPSLEPDGAGLIVEL